MSHDKELHLKQLELSALLEVTQAINANIPEDALYKIYHFTLITNLQIGKLALFVLDDTWNCKVNYGTKVNYKNSSLCEELLEYKKISRLSGTIAGFEEFDTIIPITHKDKVLAYVLAGGVKSVKAESSEPELSFLQTFTNIIIVAVENKKLARKELQQESLRKEMQIARDVQSMLFPKKLPNTEGLKVFASYYPHYTIGGDYYDFIQLSDERFIVCIGDVSGKGIPAALLMSNFQASLRTLVRKTTDLSEIVTELNYNILENANGEKFITFFIAYCDMTKMKMHYINAGHNPPVLVSSKEVRLLENGTTILGVFKKLPFINVQTLDLSENTLLFAYTDGVTDVYNKKQEEFGPEKLNAFIEANASTEQGELHSKLYGMLELYREGMPYPDDITFISCFIKGA